VSNIVIKSVAELFGVLSNPIRVEIIVLLAEQEKDVKEIHSKLGLSSSNVSQHLSILRSHHLVTLRKQETRVFYKLNNKKVITIIRKTVELLESEISEAETLKQLIDKVKI